MRTVVESNSSEVHGFGGIGRQAVSLQSEAMLLLLLLVSAWAFRPFEQSGRFRTTRTKAFESLLTALGDESLVQSVGRAGFTSDEELVSFATDFRDRPEVLSNVLRDDFHFNAIDAHKLRAALMQLLRSQDVSQQQQQLHQNQQIREIPLGAKSKLQIEGGEETKRTRANMKRVVLNQSQSQRHRRKDASSSFEYGLKKSDVPPALAAELEAFFTYMTEMSPTSQEAPIRQATAVVYERHARLFLGWLVRNGGQASITSAFPTKDKSGAKHAFDFIKWLRSERKISGNYEANLLRGLTKLAKYRFSLESTSDPTYGEKSFDDIPVVRELRKVHREAGARSRLTTSRVSDERKKWLDWPEYLSVVDKAKQELETLKRESSSKTPSLQQREIAKAYQRYLVLAFFSVVPDRQRTIRELEMDRTFLREDDSWVIKHGTADYKTGRSYGDRPPLPIASELTAAVDEFIADWRPCLSPQTDHLFVQPGVLGKGQPLTQDSLYQIVSRTCFKHSGKRTNPHLLRDMVVTHVRGETNASEKELEALALFMGHSLSMQKKSYDRRTLDQKVAPAVSLMRGLARGETAA